VFKHSTQTSLKHILSDYGPSDEQYANFLEEREELFLYININWYALREKIPRTFVYKRRKAIIAYITKSSFVTLRIKMPLLMRKRKKPLIGEPEVQYQYNKAFIRMMINPDILKYCLNITSVATLLRFGYPNISCI